MALLDVYGMSVAPIACTPNSATLVTFALDATGETTGDGIATVFVPLPNKTISEVYAHVTATTGSAPTYRIKIETMSASRTPSNTPATASCWKDITASGAGAQWLGGALVANHSTGATPSPLAITVRYQSGTCDGSNFSTFARAFTTAHDINGPYQLTMTAGTWGGAGTEIGMLVVVYDDGTVHPYTLYSTGTTPITNNSPWGTGTAPLYRGNAWTPPVAMEVSAVKFIARFSDTLDFRIKVFAADATTIIAQSATFDSDQLLSSSAAVSEVYIPLPPFTHPASTKYYYMLEPTAAVNPTQFVHMVCASRAAIRAVGGDLVGAVITSGGSPTTYDNGSDGYRLYPIVPVISKIDGGSGGGGPLVGGRLVR